MYQGYTEPEDVIIARMKRILEGYPPIEPAKPIEAAVRAEMASLSFLGRLQVLCFALSLWIRTQLYQ